MPNAGLSMCCPTGGAVACLWHDPVTRLHVLPAVVRPNLSHTAELISSGAMADFLKEYGKDYDYIISTCRRLRGR